MPVNILMPALSPTMEKGNLSKWLKKEGDTIIESVKKTNRCVVVEEGWQQSGIGAEVAARIMEQAFDYLDAPVARVSGKDVPMPYAANLEKLALPSVAEVVDAAKAVMYR